MICLRLHAYNTAIYLRNFRNVNHTEIVSPTFVKIKCFGNQPNLTVHSIRWPHCKQCSHECTFVHYLNYEWSDKTPLMLILIYRKIWWICPWLTWHDKSHGIIFGKQNIYISISHKTIKILMSKFFCFKGVNKLTKDS